jgi:hypothetical protein
MAAPLGFAAKLPNNCFDNRERFKCNKILFAKSDPGRLLMGPDGRIFATCDCLLGNLQLGTWQTPLSKLMLRKKMLQNHLMKFVLSNKHLKWNKWPCEECAAMVQRNFTFD